MKARRFSELSPSGQSLIRLCQRVNFGSIANVTIRNGEVRLDSYPEVTCDIRLDRDVGTRQEVELPDFIVGDEVSRLFDRIENIQQGTVEVIVHEGIPRRILVRRPLEECEEGKGNPYDRNLSELHRRG